jgi:hypothetical protein
MREHEYTVELPHAAPRLWALFQRYDLWKEYAPAVLDVEIVYPGDDRGNGLLRRVVYPLPFGRRGESFELVKNVKPGVGYDYVMIRSGLEGSVALEPMALNRTRFRFRSASTEDAGAPPVRGVDLPVHQQEERRIHARRPLARGHPSSIPARDALFGLAARPVPP